MKTAGRSPGNRGPPSFYPEGRTYSPPLKQAVVALPLVGYVRSSPGQEPPAAVALRNAPAGAVRGGLRLLRETLDKAAFLPNCQPCPRSRRRGFRFGSSCSWGGILPPHPAACLRQPATSSLTQIQGWNKSFHPCRRYVAFHDVPVAIEYRRRAAAFHSSPSERTVDNGDLSFGGQNGQPWSRTLRRGCCGLSELFPDAQRVRRGAA